MKLAVKLGLGAIGLVAIGGIAYGIYYFTRELSAAFRLLNDCGGYECDECPTSGLCGVDKKED
ncbi:hypothetical protein J5500_04680 [Candidatus Saccharibacteria bacterium]|nr:hypothetical protein [Candidatus Saccharibacteria bacterium]